MDQNLVNPFNNLSTTARSTNWIIFAHKWTIANFTRLYESDNPWKWQIFSGRFSPPNNPLLQLELCLFAKDFSEKLKDCVSIGFDVKDIPKIFEGKIKCACKVSIEDANGVKCETKGIQINLFISEHKMMGFIKYSDLLKESHKYLVNDQLTIHIEFHLSAQERIFSASTDGASSSHFDCATKVTQVAHKWTIDNFVRSIESANTSYFIQLEHFPVDQPERFCLQLYQKGLSEETKDYVDIGIRNDNDKVAIVHIKVSLIDLDNEECNTREYTWKINPFDGRMFGLNRDHLLDHPNGILLNSKLQINFEMGYMLEGILMKKNEKINDKVYESVSHYNFNQKAIHFVEHKWTINKFSAFSRLHRDAKSQINSPIDSQIFKPRTETGYQFLLRLWPNGRVGLKNVSQHFDEATAQYRLSILSKNGDKFAVWIEQSTISKGNIVENSKFFSRFYFQNKSIMDQYLPDDKLTILCELWVLQNRKIFKTKSTNHDTHSLVNNPSGSSTAVVNIINSALNAVALNVQGAISINDFTVTNVKK